MNDIARDLLNGWQVLVIDDDPSSLDIASTLLAKYGATVYQAEDGLAALKLLETVRPDLIVSDLAMPEMDGWELIDRLKNNRATIEIPVIALTASDWDSGRQRAMAAGFHNFLSKPLTPKTFINDLLALLVDVPQFAEYFNK